VRNGSFESIDQAQGLPGEWTITDVSKVSLLNDPLSVKVGSVSLSLSGPVKFTQDIRDWKGLEGSTVTLGAWIKGSSGDSVKFSIDDGVAKQEKTTSLVDTQWKFVTFKTTAINSSAQYLKVELEIVSTATGISLDGVMLSQVTKGVAFVPNPDDQEKSPQDLIYTDTVNGNVGIGTNTPQTTLDVLGEIHASDKIFVGEEEVLTVTKADGQYVDTAGGDTILGDLIVNGLLTSGSGKVLNDLEVAGLVKAVRFQGDGSGLTNILSQWKSSADGSGIYFDQGNVGIGISEPSQKLSVFGGTIRGDLGTIGQSLVLTGLESNLQISHDGSHYLGFLNSGGGFQFRTGNEWESINLVTISGGGNVGIGTTEPDMRLESKTTVDGIATAGSAAIGGFRIRGSTFYNTVLDMGIGVWGTWIQATDAGDLSQKYSLSLNPNGGNVGIGTTSPDTGLHVVVPSGVNDIAHFRSDSGDADVVIGAAAAKVASIYTKIGQALSLGTNQGVERMRITSDGNIGIGTTNPNAPLDVSGDIRLTGNIIPDGDICIGRCN